MKKVFSLLFSLSFAASLSTTAFAEGISSTTLASLQDSTSVTASTSTTLPSENSDVTTPGAITIDPATTPGAITVPGKTLTDEQRQAREAFQDVYMTKMTEIVTLRTQTQTAWNTNLEISKQIKDKLDTIDKTVTSDLQSKIQAAKAGKTTLLNQLKENNEKVKTLNSTKKQYDQQNKDLTKQFQKAIKSKDTTLMASIQGQIDALKIKINEANTQLSSLNTISSDLKTQISNYDAQNIKPLEDQLKTARQTVKQKRDAIKTQMDSAKAISTTINQKEAAKNKIWATYSSDVHAFNYTAAATDLQNIIDAKKEILDLINQRTQILNTILTSIS